jgi:hypothetical protein
VVRTVDPDDEQTDGIGGWYLDLPNAALLAEGRTRRKAKRKASPAPRSSFIHLQSMFIVTLSVTAFH